MLVDVDAYDVTFTKHDVDEMVDYLEEHGMYVLGSFKDDIVDVDGNLVQRMMYHLLDSGDKVYTQEDFKKKICELIDDNYCKIYKQLFY